MLTAGEIKEILQQEHLVISKRRGQNFLVDRWVQKKIIAAIDIKADDRILEIGAGLGALTEDLLKLSQRVIAVEKDRALARILQQKLSRYKNLKTICADILLLDLGKVITKKIIVVGNLPYCITTPIIGYLLERNSQRIQDIFITVQAEVARRLLAIPGQRDYSAVSVFIHFFTRPEFLFSIPKRAFYPQPKVDSTFIRLGVLPKPAVKINSQEQFFKIVRACFRQRRKTILNSLTHGLKQATKDEIQQALVEAGIDVWARPEELSLQQFAEIEDVFYRALSTK